MRFLQRLWALTRRRRVKQEIDEELRAHIEMRIADSVAAGMSEEEARRLARLSFGNPEVVRERVQAVDLALTVDSIFGDARFALRQFRRSPGFASAAVLMLALGVGANTVIFSAVNAVLLKPLPYAQANRLVRVWDQNPKTGSPDKMTGYEWSAWQARGASVFSGMAAGWDESYTLTGAGDPESLIAFQFTPNVFSVFGSTPVLGRTFTEGETHVTVLSNALWVKHFGGRRDLVGQSITLNKEPYTVVGVMPKDFDFPGKVDLWTPVILDAGFSADDKIHALHGVARLKDGVTIAQARAALNSVDSNTSNGERRGAVVQSLRDAIVGDASAALLILQAAVLLLMLVAIANTAGILLARATVREHEVAIRTALGATRLRLFLQLLVEGLTLAVLGGGLGILLAGLGLSSLTRLFPPNIDLRLPTTVLAWMDFRVVAFAVGVSVLSGVVFSSAPALRLRSAPNQALGAGQRGATVGTRTTRLRSLLVGVQVTFSVVLLVGSGLLLRSFLKLQSQSFGYRTDHVLTMQMLIANMDPVREPEWIGRILDAIQGVPGVESAAAISGLPLSGANARRPYSLPGTGAPSADVVAEFRMVTPAWFHTMAIPILNGRAFDERDRQGAPGVVIVNESLARRLWPDQNPVGKTIVVPDFGRPETREVVGVVGDTRHHELAKAPEPEIYRPLYQTFFPFLGIAIQTSGDPRALADTVRRVFHSVAPEQPLGPTLTMEERAAELVAMRRDSAMLVGVFSFVAFLLATIGIYGVVSYSIARRTKEIGVRLVLGARRRDVTLGVMREGMTIVLSGLVVGVIAAMALTRLLRNLLYGVSVWDPATFLVVPVVLMTVAGIACYIPARRAIRIDPMVALRYE